MSLLKWRPGLLSAPVGNNHVNNPEDIINMKDAYARVGRYARPVTNGYIDAELSNAIHGIQRDYNLKRDGYMTPGGETEATLIGETLGIERKSEPSDNIQQASAVPAIAVPLMRKYGLPALGLAMEAWKNRTPQQRANDMDDIESYITDPKDPNQRRCAAMLIRENAKCAIWGKKTTPEKGSICHASASERYAQCLKGIPERDWPDLRDY